MKDLKLNQPLEISYEEAAEIMKGNLNEYHFTGLNETTITETIEFETVQNRQFYLTKIGRKGSIVYRGSEFEYASKNGLFQLEMNWDYCHPSNFAQNENNLSQTFECFIK